LQSNTPLPCGRTRPSRRSSEPTGEADRGDVQPHAPREAAEREGEPAGPAAPDAASYTQPDRKERAERPAPLPSDSAEVAGEPERDRKSTRLHSSHLKNSSAVFC